ncbi:MAG TPA: thioredoxin family protein [Terrimicrobiaceae bacterium]
MKVFRCLALVALNLVFGASFSLAAVPAEGWQSDYKAALEQAAKENKMVLLDFTGSDWCGWCIKLRKDTFSKPEFRKLAAEKLVLVEIDFPRQKEQTAEVKKQNEDLLERFGVQGFPTLVLLDPQGKEAARNVGYLAGGPEGFAKWVESAQQR